MSSRSVPHSAWRSPGTSRNGDRYMDIDNLPEVREARKKWLDGGSALPLVRLMAERGAKVEAAAVARLALVRPECKDAAELEALLSSLSSPPLGWAEALAEFAASPSLERWRELMRFVPPEYAHLRLRDAVRQLRTLGVDGDTLFACASDSGLTPDLIALVEDGCVSPETLVQRATRAGAAKATYLGLAAEAAFLGGDMLGTVRLLREAMSWENEMCGVFPHVHFIRERATPEQREMLDRAGVPEP